MAQKRPRRTSGAGDTAANDKTHIVGAGEVVQEPVTATIENNFMPYAMSVILSRAIPEIDGFKPSHRKILYTMYKMGLLTGTRSKSANIVGRTMQLNPHGDASIYETMVLLSRGYEKLLHPSVDSKGNFGKAYSRDMMWAASRYTEAKLDGIAAELFRDIDKDTVDFTDNYDATMKEPVLLPVRFPSVVVNYNAGIAVGMASQICSFNLREVCEATILLSRDVNADLFECVKGPDFRAGASILFDRESFAQIFETGRGTFRMRAKYRYDKSANCIDIYEIPATTTAEAVLDKVAERVKTGQLREISDIRDETDKSGLKITVDLKRGTDPEKTMLTLYKQTTLEDSFACNFNVLIDGMPKVLGLRQLLLAWIEFRVRCIARGVAFSLAGNKEKLHLLQGLEKILLDIDKAVRVVRETEAESEVVANLMIAFGIDKIQAEYVAEIRLRHLNREYILKRTQEIGAIQKEITDMEDILAKPARRKAIMVAQLKEIAARHGTDRRSEILYEYDSAADDDGEAVRGYTVRVLVTREGYIKKIPPASLRGNAEQKLKENDSIARECDADGADDLLVFTNRQQVYKASLSEFEDCKPAALGDYLPAKLGMDDGEKVVSTVLTHTYQGYMLFAFENGKIAKINLQAYATQQRRRKLVNAYSDKSPLAASLFIENDCDCLAVSSDGRCLLFGTGSIAPKNSRDSIGVGILNLKNGRSLQKLELYAEGRFENPLRYRTKTLPAAGMLPTGADAHEQLSLLEK
jgi:DNA gyrase subunit A